MEDQYTLRGASFGCIVEQVVRQHVICEEVEGVVFFVFTHDGAKHQTRVPADNMLSALIDVRRKPGKSMTIEALKHE